jgi:hypothetical protein
MDRDQSLESLNLVGKNWLSKFTPMSATFSCDIGGLHLHRDLGIEQARCMEMTALVADAPARRFAHTFIPAQKAPEDLWSHV